MRPTLLLMPLMLMAACAPAGDTPTVDVPGLEARIAALTGAFPGATVAVSVRDPFTGTNFDILGDRLFHAASTMKVPVMIEVYRQSAAGRLDLADSMVVRNAFRSIVDGSTFRIEDDSDDGIYDLLGERMTVAELVTHMITVSSNLATNLLIARVTADSVQATSERLGTRQMQTLRGVEDLKAYEQGRNNRTTSADLAVLMTALMGGHAVSPAADSEMVAVLLEQDFNEMIPAHLPPGTRVAHKTGQITAIHHDAAIVFPSTGAPFVLVVLIEGLANDADSAGLGAGIARLVYDALRPPA